jgi:hypothetical protein
VIVTIIAFGFSDTKFLGIPEFMPPPLQDSANAELEGVKTRSLAVATLLRNPSRQEGKRGVYSSMRPFQSLNVFLLVCHQRLQTLVVLLTLR